MNPLENPETRRHATRTVFLIRKRQSLAQLMSKDKLFITFLSDTVVFIKLLEARTSPLENH